MTVLICGVIGVVLLSIWAVGSPNSELLCPVIGRRPPGKRRVCLTFDDGPDPELTPLALDILKRHRAKATFFVVGERVAANAAILARASRSGHVIGVHDYRHAALTLHFQGPRRMARELVRTGLAIQAAVGYFPRFHRSPVGVKSPPRAFVAGKLGLALVGWTRRALDGGARPLNEKSVQRLLNDTRDGDIVALHDGKLNLRGESIAASADADAFAKALETLVSGLTQKGFQLVALDEATGMSRDLPGAPQSLETMPAMGYFAMARYVVNRVVFANVGAAEVIGGFALGVFLGCSPFLGARAVLSVIVAGRLRLNRAAAAIGSGVGYPFLASPLIAAAIWVGQTIMTGAPPAFSATAFQYHPLTDIADHFFWPWLIGFPLVGGLAAVIAWLVLSFLFVPRKSRF